LDCETETEASASYSRYPDWVFPGRLRSTAELGNVTNTGQVHPRLFTRFLASHAEANGVEIVYGSAVGLGYSDAGAVTSISYTPQGAEEVQELEADVVVLAAGPWTSKLLPNAPIAGARSHSIVLDVPTSTVPPEILFFNRPHPHSWFPKLEVYPRPDETAYFCGSTDFDVPLPDSTALVEVNKQSCQLIRRAAESLSDRFAGRELLVEQACYRPVMTVPGRDRSVGPLVGMTSTAGLILAAGHDSWGIQNSLGTGKILSELIFEGRAVSADISTLDPKIVLGNTTGH
jgi:glycine/D-amino acid oxidase-like deaminating enzyme